VSLILRIGRQNLKVQVAISNMMLFDDNIIKPAACGCYQTRSDHATLERNSHQIAGARHRHHVMMRQMNHGHLDARIVLHRRRDFGRKLAAMHLAAGALRFEHLVFGGLVMQTRNVEYLTGLDNSGRGQRTKTGIQWLGGAWVST
jgi:hypothetical protein